MPLNVVVPDGFAGSKAHVTRSRVSRLFERVWQLWYLTKISRRGHYSNARTEVLNAYCQRASLSRAVLVCAVTPLPALLLAIILEIVPLQNPTEGWEANYGTWIRLCGFITSASLGSLYQIHDATPELSHNNIFCIGIGTGCGATLTMISVAALWGVFPIPFGIAMTSFPFQILFMASLLGSIRRDRSSFFPRVSARLKYKLYLIVGQSVLAFVYISFGIIFTRCSSKQQIGLLIFLPVMKLGFKHLVAWLASDDKETIPAVVVFTVDVFNGLYVSTCIQSSRSWWASILMIALNIGRSLLSLWDIERGARVLDALDNLNRDSQLGDQTRQPLGRSGRNRRYSVSLFPSGRIAASDAVQAVNSPHKPQQSRLTSVNYEAKLNRCSRKMLFHLEYLVLVEYIESVIPTLYVIYLSVLVHLPSAKYYSYARNLTSSQLRTNVGSIMLYASVEMLSIMWLHIILQRKFGFSLLHQLAFVLETEKELLQGRLFVWITPLLQITLVHFGLDFTFQFNWLD